ncbi:hypothetical protein FB451DRAFT_1162795 [Mycena latifolia]|nr:hypothetical protein FB451DRAFT_1162795 [Mycena latifolia]
MSIFLTTFLFDPVPRQAGVERRPPCARSRVRVHSWQLYGTSRQQVNLLSRTRRSVTAGEAREPRLRRPPCTRETGCRETGNHWSMGGAEPHGHHKFERAGMRHGAPSRLWGVVIVVGPPASGDSRLSNRLNQRPINRSIRRPPPPRLRIRASFGFHSRKSHQPMRDRIKSSPLPGDLRFYSRFFQVPRQLRLELPPTSCTVAPSTSSPKPRPPLVRNLSVAIHKDVSTLRAVSPPSPSSLGEMPELHELPPRLAPHTINGRAPVLERRKRRRGRLEDDYDADSLSTEAYEDTNRFGTFLYGIEMQDRRRMTSTLF